MVPLLGLLLLTLGIGSAATLLRSKNRPYYKPGWFVFATLLGMALGAWPSGGYMLDAKTRAFGFPFMTFVLQQDQNGDWLDYVGWTTPVFMVCNFLIATGLPIIVFGLVVRFRKGARRTIPQDLVDVPKP